MRGGLDGSIEVSVRVRVKFRTWLFRVSVLSLLSIVPSTVEWGSEAPLAILAQGHGDERVLMTQVGERQDVRLANGSHAVLNTNTQAIAYESWGHQQVDLSLGEMLFETVTRRATPLRVAAGYIEIEATNARFSVRRTADACAVSVFDGEVVVYASGPSIHSGMRRGSIVAVKLVSGRGITVWSDHAAFSQFDTATAKRLLSWLNGTLIFKDASLADVVAQFNRYNRERLEVVDDSIAKLRIGGSYPANDPQHFAEDLRPLGIRAVRASAGAHGEIVILLTKAPGPTKPQTAKPPNREHSRPMPKEHPQCPCIVRPREGLDAVAL